MKKWYCYLIRSFQEPRFQNELTYVGASVDPVQRLSNHNRNDPSIKRIGAIRTRGRTWVPILIIEGFISKQACLSFESQWKRLSRTRNSKRLDILNTFSDCNLYYTADARYNRIIDLLYFVHNLTIYNEKFTINRETRIRARRLCSLRLPVVLPDKLIIRTFLADWIANLPWPPFVDIINN